MVRGVHEPDADPPVVEHEIDVLETDRFDELSEPVGMLPRSEWVGLVGEAEVKVVRHDHPVGIGDMRDDIAPHVRLRRQAVEHDDDVAQALVEVVHVQPIGQFREVRLVGVAVVCQMVVRGCQTGGADRYGQRKGRRECEAFHHSVSSLDSDPLRLGRSTIGRSGLDSPEQ